MCHADRLEQRVGLGGRDPGRDDADVDPAGIHGGQQMLEGGGGQRSPPRSSRIPSLPA